MPLFVSLFLNTKKNYMFEKYSFLTFSSRNKTIVFNIWYFWKSQILLALLIAICYNLFQSTLLNTVVLGALLITKFLVLGVEHWQLFKRNDFVLAIADVKERFLTILLGNIVLKLLVEDNIVVMMSLLLLNMGVSFIYLPLMILSYILLFSATQSVYFIFLYSSLKVKHLFSITSYLTSFVCTVSVVYIVISGIVSSFVTFTKMDQPEMQGWAIFGFLWSEGVAQIKTWTLFLAQHLTSSVLIGLGYMLFVGWLTGITLKYIERKKYDFVANDRLFVTKLLLVNFSQKMYAFFNKNKEELNVFVMKEYAIFIDTYKYNFRKYFFIFVSDRLFFWFIAIFMILLKFNVPQTYVILFVLVPIILAQDIGNVMTGQLLPHMSFLADYNTLLQANTIGFDLDKLVQAKFMFFYSVKCLAYFIFFVAYNIMFVIVAMPWTFIVLNNILNLSILWLLPRMYFTNNLIYNRMDYKNYDIYVNELSFLEGQLSDFYPMRVLHTMWVFVLLFVSVVVGLSRLNDPTLMVLLLCAFMFFSIIVVHKMMRRVHANIFQFIKRGNYSADFAKIFKG